MSFRTECRNNFKPGSYTELFTGSTTPRFSITAASLLYVFSLCLSGSAYGYDVETGHGPLTEQAFAAYQNCFPDDATFTDNNRRHILLGNIAMDKGSGNLPLKYQDNTPVHMLFDFVIRPFNWHFYNPNKTSKAITQRGFVDQSQRRLWQRAKDGFSGMDEAEDKALFLGALMHLTEDVSVPAHVIPVYHGPTFAVLLGQFNPLIEYLKKAGRTDGSMISDAIDKLSPDGTWIAAQFTSASSPLCGMPTDDSPDLIRQQLAQATLDAVQTSIDNCNDTPWEIFWNGKIDSTKNKYFMAYNINIPEFNHHGNIVDANCKQQCVMREGDWRYRQFVNARHLDAIKADLRLLRWASHEIANP